MFSLPGLGMVNARSAHLCRFSGSRRGWGKDQARLIDAALADSPAGTREWGISTECGMGRAGREEMPVLLDLHRQILAGG